MDTLTMITIAIIGIIGVAMLYRISRNMWGVVAIILAMLNDLSDIGLLSLQGYEWVWDVAVFVLLLLWCRNYGSFIALLDIIPYVSGVPFNTIAVAVAYAMKEREEAKKE